jgi:hypothetical protein
LSLKTYPSKVKFPYDILHLVSHSRNLPVKGFTYRTHLRKGLDTLLEATDSAYSHDPPLCMLELEPTIKNEEEKPYLSISNHHKQDFARADRR